MVQIGSFEEFKNFYEDKGYLPDGLGKRKNKLNEKQLQSRYQKYLQSIEKKKLAKDRHITTIQENQKLKSSIIDELWIEARSKVFERDHYKCRLISLLSASEYKEFVLNAGGFKEILDSAHIISRSYAPHMIYEIDNIVVLNRYAHSNLDQYRSPINGKQISREEHDNWWIRIIGKNLFDKLVEKANNK